jgi:hypothetical protein
MATKKQNPAVAKRVAERKAFVQDKVASKGVTAKQARQRFYVQSRMAELKAAGKTVTPETRKKLQQKFQSGDVSRKGFAAPKKKTGTTGKTGTTKKVTSVKPTSRIDSRGSTGFGKRGMGTPKSYSYTKQSGEKNTYTMTPDHGPNKPAYSRSQIIRNIDMNTKKKSNPSTTGYRRTS